MSYKSPAPATTAHASQRHLGESYLLSGLKDKELEEELSSIHSALAGVQI